MTVKRRATLYYIIMWSRVPGNGIFFLVNNSAFLYIDANDVLRFVGYRMLTFLPPAYVVRGKVIFILGNVCLFTFGRGYPIQPWTGGYLIQPWTGGGVPNPALDGGVPDPALDGGRATQSSLGRGGFPNLGQGGPDPALDGGVTPTLDRMYPISRGVPQPWMGVPHLWEVGTPTLDRGVPHLWEGTPSLQGSHIYWKTWKNESTPGKPGKIMEFCKK